MKKVLWTEHLHRYQLMNLKNKVPFLTNEIKVYIKILLSFDYHVYQWPHQTNESTSYESQRKSQYEAKGETRVPITYAIRQSTAAAVFERLPRRQHLAVNTNVAKTLCRCGTNAPAHRDGERSTPRSYEIKNQVQGLIFLNIFFNTKCSIYKSIC